MIIRKNLKNILVILCMAVLAFGCSKDSNDVQDDDGGMNTDPVQAAFTTAISTTNPNVLLLNNTTTGTGFSSFWNFGLGGGNVEDGPGIEEVTYSNPGNYTIKLFVLKGGVTTTATTTIAVDDSGICPNGNCGAGGTESLKSAATTFSVGTITRASYVNGGGQHTQTLKGDFNSLTSEYEMKMNVMYPSQGNFNFSAGDAIVNFAQANNMNVHGHALIWHSATPSWVENFAGTNAEFEAMVENYISTTVNHFKGKVRSWDVVNEAFEDGTGHPLRNSVFRQKMGDDYVKKCFQFARNADPNALLFYNDYNVASSSTKRAAIFNLVDNLGSLIDGVGAQMHISYNGPSAANIQDVADKTVARGLKLHFSEIDIRTNPEGDSGLTSLSNEKALLQKSKMKEVVKIYNAIPLDNKFAITVWGVRDPESWLINFWGVPDWPLLFDAGYNKKPMYYGFLEGLE